jgi:hypothetical protein
MFMVFPVPVSLFCKVSKLLLAFLRMVLAILFTVAELRVRVPVVVELLPIVRARVLALVTSIAPMLRDAVFILIPAVVAVPALANWAMLVVSQAPEAVSGFQLVSVYQAVEPAEAPASQVIVWPEAVEKIASSALQAAARNRGSFD